MRGGVDCWITMVMPMMSMMMSMVMTVVTVMFMVMSWILSRIWVRGITLSGWGRGIHLSWWRRGIPLSRWWWRIILVWWKNWITTCHFVVLLLFETESSLSLVGVLTTQNFAFF